MKGANDRPKDTWQGSPEPETASLLFGVSITDRCTILPLLELLLLLWGRFWPGLAHNRCLGNIRLRNWVPGLPWWLSGKESACQCRSHGFDPWPGRIPYASEQAKPMLHNYWPHTLQLLKPGCPRACPPQLEKPPQSEAWIHHNQRLAPTSR